MGAVASCRRACCCASAALPLVCAVQMLLARGDLCWRHQGHRRHPQHLPGELPELESCRAHRTAQRGHAVCVHWRPSPPLFRLPLAVLQYNSNINNLQALANLYDGAGISAYIKGATTKMLLLQQQVLLGSIGASATLKQFARQVARNLQVHRWHRLSGGLTVVLVCRQLWRVQARMVTRGPRLVVSPTKHVQPGCPLFAYLQDKLDYNLNATRISGTLAAATVQNIGYPPKVHVPALAVGLLFRNRSAGGIGHEPAGAPSPHTPTRPPAHPLTHPPTHPCPTLPHPPLLIPQSSFAYGRKACICSDGKINEACCKKAWGYRYGNEVDIPISVTVQPNCNSTTTVTTSSTCTMGWRLECYCDGSESRNVSTGSECLEWRAGKILHMCTSGAAGFTQVHARGPHASSPDRRPAQRVQTGIGSGRSTARLFLDGAWCEQHCTALFCTSSQLTAARSLPLARGLFQVLVMLL